MIGRFRANLSRIGASGSPTVFCFVSLCPCSLFFVSFVVKAFSSYQRKKFFQLLSVLFISSYLRQSFCSASLGKLLSCPCFAQAQLRFGCIGVGGNFAVVFQARAGDDCLQLNFLFLAAV